MLIKRMLSLLLAVTLITCNRANSKYENSIKKWHQSRIDYLKSEEGFVNLAGLYWLKEGINTFGSDSSNNLNFTPKSLPNMGSFLNKDSMVYLITTNEITIDGNIVSDTSLIFENGKSEVMNFKSLSWFIVKRANNIGVRLRDFNNPLLQKFDSIDYFKTDFDWRVEAYWKPYEKPIEVSFANVLGMAINYPVKGAFYFSL